MTDTPTTETESPEPRPFQFTIGSLMIFTVIVAIFFALVTQSNIIVAATFTWFLFLVVTLWMFSKRLDNIALFIFIASHIFWAFFLLVVQLG